MTYCPGELALGSTSVLLQITCSIQLQTNANEPLFLKSMQSLSRDCTWDDGQGSVCIWG